MFTNTGGFPGERVEGFVLLLVDSVEGEDVCPEGECCPHPGVVIVGFA